jgi:hypothetical protein
MELTCSQCGAPTIGTPSKMTVAIDGTIYWRWICPKCGRINVKLEDETMNAGYIWGE